MIIKRRKWRVFKDGSMNNFVERSSKTESQIASNMEEHIINLDKSNCRTLGMEVQTECIKDRIRAEKMDHCTL